MGLAISRSIIEAHECCTQFRRAPANRRRGIVQFMSEAGGEFAERNQLFIVEVAGSEMSRAIDHDVYENGSQLATFTFISSRSAR
jgi:hypothetical protein